MSGINTPGLPAAVLPLVGTELIPLDVPSSVGVPPTSAATVAQLKQYVFGNAARTDGTASAGAVTLTGASGKVTSESLTTAAGAVYTLTITDAAIAAADIVMASVAYGTSTTGSPVVTRVQPAAGSLVILVQNVHASAALNGTIVVSFFSIET